MPIEMPSHVVLDMKLVRRKVAQELLLCCDGRAVEETVAQGRVMDEEDYRIQKQRCGDRLRLVLHQPAQDDRAECTGLAGHGLLGLSVCGSRGPPNLAEPNVAVTGPCRQRVGIKRDTFWSNRDLYTIDSIVVDLSGGPRWPRGGRAAGRGPRPMAGSAAAGLRSLGARLATHWRLRSRWRAQAHHVACLK
eukprot:COSAG06_NODE_16853_length_977_cov_1.082005_2_plen_191_part_00